jgi:hypothetical protein
MVERKEMKKHLEEKTEMLIKWSGALVISPPPSPRSTAFPDST